MVACLQRTGQFRSLEKLTDVRAGERHAAAGAIPGCVQPSRDRFTPETARQLPYLCILFVGVAVSLTSCGGAIPSNSVSLKHNVKTCSRLEVQYFLLPHSQKVVITDEQIIKQIAQSLVFSVEFRKGTSDADIGKFFVVDVFSGESLVERFRLVAGGGAGEVTTSRGGGYIGYLSQKSSTLVRDILLKQFQDAGLIESDQPKPTFRVESLTLVSSSSIGYERNVGEHMSLSSDKEFLFVTDSFRQLLLCYRLRENDRLLFVRSFYTPGVVEPVFHPIAQSEMTLPTFVEPSPDGKHVYVCSKKDNAIVAFNTHATRGLSEDGVMVIGNESLEMKAFAYPEAIAVSPDGKHAYVTSRTTRQVYVLDRNLSGTLKYVASVPMESQQQTRVQDADVQELHRNSHLVISEDGKFVYVTESIDGSLLCYERQVDDGGLELVQHLWDNESTGNRGLKHASSILISPNGKLAIVTSLTQGISVWNRDTETGKLSFLQRVDEQNIGREKVFTGARAIAIRADGRRLYVASQADGTITVFRCDTNGKLSLLEILKQGDLVAREGKSPAKLTVLSGARCLILAPDGKRLYVGTSKCSAVRFATTRLETTDAAKKWNEALLTENDDDPDACLISG